MKPFHGLGPDDSALAILHEGIPLIIGNNQFGYHLALVLGIDDELRKEILLVLIDATKPVVVRDIFHARNTQDLVAVRQRDQIDDGRTVDDYQAIRAGDVGPRPNASLTTARNANRNSATANEPMVSSSRIFLRNKLAKMMRANFMRNSRPAKPVTFCLPPKLPCRDAAWYGRERRPADRASP